MGLTSSRGKAARAVALFDDGNEIVFDELAGGVADEALVVGEQGIELDEIHTAEFDGWHEESRLQGVSAHVLIGDGTQRELLKLTNGVGASNGRDMAN